MKFRNTCTGKLNPRALKKAGLSGAVHMVACPGHAHDPSVNGMITNCGICAQRWGEIDVPVECVSSEDWLQLRDNIVTRMREQEHLS